MSATRSPRRAATRRCTTTPRWSVQRRRTVTGTARGVYKLSPTAEPSACRENQSSYRTPPNGHRAASSCAWLAESPFQLRLRSERDRAKGRAQVWTCVVGDRQGGRACCALEICTPSEGLDLQPDRIYEPYGRKTS